MQGHLPFSLIGHSEDGDIQKLLHSTNRCSDPNENDTAVPLCPIYIPNHSRILESTSTRLYFCSEILGTLELIYWRNFCLTRMGCAAPTLINTINESYQKKKKNAINETFTCSIKQGLLAASQLQCRWLYLYAIKYPSLPKLWCPDLVSISQLC